MDKSALACVLGDNSVCVCLCNYDTPVCNQLLSGNCTVHIIGDGVSENKHHLLIHPLGGTGFNNANIWLQISSMTWHANVWQQTRNELQSALLFRGGKLYDLKTNVDEITKPPFLISEVTLSIWLIINEISYDGKSRYQKFNKLTTADDKHNRWTAEVQCIGNAQNVKIATCYSW